MAVKISAKVNFKPIIKSLGSLERDISTKAAPRALNRAMVTVKKEAVKEAKKLINLPTRGSSKGGEGRTPPGLSDLMSTTYATTSTLATDLNASTKPVSLIHFVVGSKDPASQKDLFLKHRKSVSVKVVPGLKWKLGKSFLAKSNGAVQVFVRATTKGLPIIKRGVVGLFNFMNNDAVIRRLKEIGRERFITELKRDISFYTSKMAQRLSK